MKKTLHGASRRQQHRRVKSKTSRATKKRSYNVKVPGLGARVKQCRERQNLPVNELGRRIGRSGSLISRIEREETQPSVAVLAGIAAALDCSIDFLVTGVESIPRRAVITRKSVGDNWTEIEVKLDTDGLIVVAK